MHTNANLWLPGIKRVPSPNHNLRPPNTVIDLIVIHNISLPAGEFGGDCVERLFTNCLDCSAHSSFESLRGLQVSSHLFINRDGQLCQFVPLALRAWHAGESYFAGRDNCNDFSIGIELEGTDDCPYTERQYQALAEVVASICSSYPDITPQRIVGHCDIAPGRKTDPGLAFDWEHFRSLLQA